ncbi:MAG: glycosyltransferase [Syntrophotaleaceae bacterium]
MKNEKGKKINILFIIDFIASKYGMVGGAERQLIDRIRYIDKSRFNPVLCCLQKRFHNEIFDKILCKNEIIHFYSFKSLKLPYKIFLLWKLIVKNKIDIVETTFFDSIFLGVITARLAKVPYVISCRRDMGFWYDKKLLFFLKILNRITDRILVNSESIKEITKGAEKITPCKIDVIKNGIDIEKFTLVEASDFVREFSQIDVGNKIVGIVANFNRKVKRVDLFIKALSEVLKTGYDCKFVIIGDGKLKKELVTLSETLGVADHLVWVGRKDNPISYIKSFNVGVICSDSEGFCNALLEYMAAGIPIVATNVGGNPELIEEGKNGFLVPPDDHHALAEAILKLLNDENLADKMGCAGARLVNEKYDWNIKIKEYEKYYQRLVGDYCIDEHTGLSGSE